MQTVLMTGGTGLVGRALSSLLVQKGYRVIILTRNTKGKINSPSIQYAQWDVVRQWMDLEALQAADFIVHLAGAGVVDKRWTARYKKEIVDSRTLSSQLLVNSLSAHPNKVQAIVSASAIGWYGPDNLAGKSFVESDPAAPGFLGETCKAWEESIAHANQLNIRVCNIRTGIVLSNDGGALAEFKKPIRMGIAGILGDGKQVVSWIHIDDLCRIFVEAIENKSLSGPMNAVAPMPVDNKTLTLSLAKAMRGHFFIPVHIPAWALRLLMGESSIEVLKSTTVSSKKLTNTGFVFLYPSIESAIQALVQPK